MKRKDIFEKQLELSPQQKRVQELRLAGKNRREIALDLGVSLSRVSAILVEIREITEDKEFVASLEGKL